MKMSHYLFCSKCRNKHALGKCPLDSIEIWVICAENHNAKEFPSIPSLKVVF